MRSFVVILLFLSVSCAFAQISDTQKNKVLRLLGDEFHELPTEKSYLNYFECDDCELDSSLVYIDKFDGAIFQNEFVLFHNSISFKKNSEVLKLMRPTYVTLEEYQEFENWIRDSIARNRLAEGIDLFNDTEVFGEFEKREKYGGGLMNSRLIKLKWNKRFSYDDLELMPALADMYLPQPQRFYRQRIFDKRKYYYRYLDNYELFEEMPRDSIQSYFKNECSIPNNCKKVEEWLPIIRDEFQLAKNSEFVRDERSTLLYFRDNEFAKYPVNGLRGFQAEAYCHWKAMLLQKLFDRKGLKFEVRLTLPLTKDVVAFLNDETIRIPVEARDYSLHWKITNAEYKEFIESVKDSVIREYLFSKLENNQDVLKLLAPKKAFLDEGGLVVKPFEPMKERIGHRNHLNLNKNYKINWKNEEVQQLLTSLPENDQFLFSYFDMNYENRIIEGKVMTRYDPKNNEIVSENYKEDYPNILRYPYYYTGYITLGDLNPVGEVKLTRSHENIQRFIEYHRIDIRPKNYPEIPSNDSLITTINYEQALAFYHWKYPIEKINEKSNWQDFVLPTKEQYEEYLRSGSYMVEAHALDYEGPFFRYVVHLFPKNK